MHRRSLHFRTSFVLERVKETTALPPGHLA